MSYAIDLDNDEVHHTCLSLNLLQVGISIAYSPISNLITNTTYITNLLLLNS